MKNLRTVKIYSMVLLCLISISVLAKKKSYSHYFKGQNKCLCVETSSFARKIVQIGCSGK